MPGSSENESLFPIKIVFLLLMMEQNLSGASRAHSIRLGFVLIQEVTDGSRQGILPDKRCVSGTAIVEMYTNVRLNICHFTSRFIAKRCIIIDIYTRLSERGLPFYFSGYI